MPLPLSTMHRLEVFSALSFVLSLSSLGRKFLFPFQIFTTWVHESCHATAAMLVGGSAIRITLEPDGSGLTHYTIPKSKFRHAIVASSGYLGASAIGCLIFFLSAQAQKIHSVANAHQIAIGLCMTLALTLLFWIRNTFGFVVVSFFASALYALAISTYRNYCAPILFFLALQTALNALFDIRNLFNLSPIKSSASDAQTLQKLFFLPAWLWAIAWLTISCCLMFWTIKNT